MSDNTSYNIFCLDYTISTHTNNIAPHSLLWPRFVISFMPHLSSESMHKPDEYVPLYSDGGIMLWCNYHLLLPVILSGLCLTIISCRTSRVGSFLSLLFLTPGKKKPQIHTHTHTIQLEAALLDFCPVESTGIIFLAGNYQYILRREAKKTSVKEGKRGW